MPFIGVNPPTNRVQGLYGGATNASAGSAPLNNIVDATAQALLGMCAWYKDPLGRISCLAYSQAQASILYGAALMKQAGGATTLNSAAASTQAGYDTSYVAMATTGVGGFPAMFAGIAAASVINTGYFFWRYITGYVPDALVGSAVPSGHMLTFAATAANWLGSLASVGTQTGTVVMPVGYSLGIANTNGGSASAPGVSVWLGGWYL